MGRRDGEEGGDEEREGRTHRSRRRRGLAAQVTRGSVRTKRCYVRGRSESVRSGTFPRVSERGSSETFDAARTLGEGISEFASVSM
jgi:hypothetical protein